MFRCYSWLNTTTCIPNRIIYFQISLATPQAFHVPPDSCRASPGLRVPLIGNDWFSLHGPYGLAHTSVTNYHNAQKWMKANYCLKGKGRNHEMTNLKHSRMVCRMLHDDHKEEQRKERLRCHESNRLSHNRMHFYRKCFTEPDLLEHFVSVAPADSVSVPRHLANFVTYSSFGH